MSMLQNVSFCKLSYTLFHPSKLLIHLGWGTFKNNSEMYFVLAGMQIMLPAGMVCLQTMLVYMVSPMGMRLPIMVGVVVMKK